jgi:hypothetical protein
MNPIIVSLVFASGGSMSAGSIAKSAMEIRTEQYAAKREAKAKEREERYDPMFSANCCVP